MNFGVARRRRAGEALLSERVGRRDQERRDNVGVIAAQGGRDLADRVVVPAQGVARGEAGRRQVRVRCPIPLPQVKDRPGREPAHLGPEERSGGLFGSGNSRRVSS